METTCVIQEPQKKQKLKEEQDIDVNGKSLGNLPEEFLKHILSFLPTKDAVRTSVLSKRWEFLWASIPNLDFELLRQVCFLKGRKDPKEHFMNSVDRVLCLRDSDIKRFTLCCDVQIDSFRFHTWISATVKHNVQELYIKLKNYEGVLSIPYKTLTSLHLDVDCLLNLPTSTCFSNLKILTFVDVTFLNERLTQQFFLVCKSLRSWNYTNAAGRNSRGLLINDYWLRESFSLEKAEIDTDTYLIPTINFCRTYSFLRALQRKTPKTFLRFDSIPEDATCTYLLPHMPMLNNLMDLIFDKYSVDLDCIGLLKTLEQCPRLKTLNFFGVTSRDQSALWKKMIGYGTRCLHVSCPISSALKSVEHLARNLEKQVKVSKQLLELPRGSQNCKMVLE
ncbi:hypothetical protein SLA2020_381840 [Shorea laevis]